MELGTCCLLIPSEGEWVIPLTMYFRVTAHACAADVSNFSTIVTRVFRKNGGQTRRVLASYPGPPKEPG